MPTIQTGPDEIDRAEALTSAPVLRKAADELAALPYARVIRTDLHRALLHAAPSYSEAKAALEVLAIYVHASGDERWLSRWVFPRSRAEVASELRDAADAAEQAAEVLA